MFLDCKVLGTLQKELLPPLPFNWETFRKPKPVQHGSMSHNRSHSKKLAEEEKEEAWRFVLDGILEVGWITVFLTSGGLLSVTPFPASRHTSSAPATPWPSTRARLIPVFPPPFLPHSHQRGQCPARPLLSSFKLRFRKPILNASSRA